MNRIAPGTRVGDRYVVLEEIGGGGVGVVFRAHDDREDRDVALKVLRELPRDGGRRLRREAAATGELDPKRVAKVHEVGETPEGELYLVMEYVAGKTARQKLREGRVPRSQALRIVREVAKTLGEAHRQGLVHRDVKPDNIMLADDGRIVLLDFGLVKTVDTPAADLHEVSTHLTGHGAVVGTPAYLAPEQAMGRPVGPAVDQFGLAVTAFELLTGQLPWSAKDMTRMLGQVIGETPRSASGIEWELAPAFDEALGKALAKKEGERFRSVEEFAEALDKVERGEWVGPAAEAGRRRLRVAAVLVGVPLAGLAIGSTLLPRTLTSAAPTHEATSTAILTRPDAQLACPILEVQGVPDVGVRLGAAAATLACSRARWYLGGRDDRVLTPAALLGVLPQPVERLPDPYADVGQRERSVAAAQSAGAEAYLDGRVGLQAEGWSIAFALRTPDGKEVARGGGRHATDLAAAIKSALADLWVAPLLPTTALDPEVARWTRFPNVEAGFASCDLLQLTDVSRICDEIHSQRSKFEPAFYRLEGSCEGRGVARLSDAGSPSLDTSSIEALLATANAEIAMGAAIEDPRALAERFDAARVTESARIGRAALALTAGELWARAKDRDRANAAVSAAVREAPQIVEAWQQLALISGELGSSENALASASAWFPNEAMFLDKATSTHSDELPARLRDARLAVLLEPTQGHVLYLGRALAEAGRLDEARALVAAPIAGAPIDPRIEGFVLAFADLHVAKLQRALERLLASGWVGLYETIAVASVLGRQQATSDQWATQFLGIPDDQIVGGLAVNVAPIALCMSASRGLAQRCLDRVDKLGHVGRNWWGEAGEALMYGARKYVRGDVRGAVEIWRPLVGGPILDVARILPTEPFEKAGEPALAARLDERKMAHTYIAGVSESAPRVAKRAAAAGDKGRARELAQKVVTAWEVADVAVPAVAEMRALLKQLDH